MLGNMGALDYPEGKGDESPSSLLPSLGSGRSQEVSNEATSPPSFTSTTPPPTVAGFFSSPEPSSSSQQNGLNTAMLLGVLHRLMAEQHQEYRQQQNAMFQLYQELQGSVRKLSEEVHQITVSLQHWNARQRPTSPHPPGYVNPTHHQNSSILTSMTGVESDATDLDHAHRRPMSLSNHTDSSLSFSSYLAQKSWIAPEGSRLHSLPRTRRSQTRPMIPSASGSRVELEEEGLTKGESEEERRKITDAEEANTVAGKKEEAVGVVTSDSTALLEAVTPRRPPYPPTPGSGLSMHSIRTMPSPILEKHPEEAQEGGHPSANEEEKMEKRSSKGHGVGNAQEGSIERGTGESTPTAQWTTTHHHHNDTKDRDDAKTHEDVALGTSILEEMSRETLHAAHYAPNYTAPLPFAPTPPNEPLFCAASLGTHLQTSAGPFYSLEEPTMSGAVGGGEGDEGGKRSSTSSIGNGGAMMGTGGAASQMTPRSTMERLQEVNAHYDSILEKIASSPLMGGGGATPSGRAKNAPSTASFWMEPAGGAGVPLTSFGGSGGGGGAGAALSHTPTPTGHLRRMISTPSGVLRSAGSPTASLHAAHSSHHLSSVSSGSPSPTFANSGGGGSGLISLEAAQGSTMGTTTALAAMSSLSSGSHPHLEPTSQAVCSRSMVAAMRNSNTADNSFSNSYHSMSGAGGGSGLAASGLPMSSTDVSAILSDDPTAAELLQRLAELPCTSTVMVMYKDGRPRVARLAKPQTSGCTSTTFSPPSVDATATNLPSPMEANTSSVPQPNTNTSSVEGTVGEKRPSGSAIAARAAAPDDVGKESTELNTSTVAVAVVPTSSTSSHAPSSASVSTAPTAATIIGDEPETYGLTRRQAYHVLVEFKRHRAVQYASEEYVSPGQYVIVGADRGQDLGLVICTWCDDLSLPSPHGLPHTIPHTPNCAVAPGTGANGGGEQAMNGFCLSPHKLTAVTGVESAESAAGSGAELGTGGLPLTGGMGFPSGIKGVRLSGSVLPTKLQVCRGEVLRMATDAEVSQLHFVQAELERRAMEVCEQRVLERKVPMVLVDAEYQYDTKKLTFFYVAQQRADFRELVRDLYKSFRARIWMEMVEDETG